MKVGAEDKKKVALLAGLAVVAVGTVYVQFFSSPSVPAGVRTPRPQPAAAAPRLGPPPPRTIPVRSERRSSAARRDFEPVWRRSHEDEAFDPLNADPTLRTDLLEAVRNVRFGGVERNIFLYGQERKPPPKPSADEIAEAQRLQQEAANRRRKPPPKPPTPSRARAPRLTWKYYGFASEAGDPERRAFLLDGDDVLIGGVGDVFKDRYEITSIGLTSVTIKDRQFEEEQTLAITAPRG